MQIDDDKGINYLTKKLGIRSLDIFQELKFTIRGNPGKVSVRTGEKWACSDVVVSSPFNDGGCVPDRVEISDLFPRKEGKVWYAHVLMLFQVTMIDTEEGLEESTHDLAYVTWYERLGSCTREETRRFRDPDFPAALVNLFPRIFLVEPDLEPSYAVIPVADIIAPAPTHDDVSVRHITAVDDANSRNLTGAGRALHIQNTPPLSAPLVPDKHRCKNERRNTPCIDPSCTR